MGLRFRRTRVEVKASPQWWQRGPIYQLLVPSFLDTDGDGFGDLHGVIARLDYLKWFGASAVWSSPIFRSPLRDLGYDVIDFSDVDPRFGSLEVFDELLAEAHRRDLRILIDWVLNHTSSDHEWFVASRANRDSGRPLLVYERGNVGEAVLVVLNFGPDAHTFRLGPRHGRVPLSTFLDRDAEELREAIAVRGDEGFLIEMR